MRLDNQKNTYRIWVQRLILAVVFTLLIILLIFVPWFDQEDAVLNEYHIIIAIALIYVGINVINGMKSHSFVAYSDHGETILLRYYPLSLFNSRKNSIEIPKQQFVKYELKPFFYGRHHKLVLYQNFRNRVLPYPPVSLSALEKEDREQLLASLEKNLVS